MSRFQSHMIIIGIQLVRIKENLIRYECIYGFNVRCTHENSNLIHDAAEVNKVAIFLLITRFKMLILEAYTYILLLMGVN